MSGATSSALGWILYALNIQKLPVWVFLALGVVLILAGVFAAFHEMRVAHDRLEHAMNNRAHRRWIADELGAFLLDGRDNLTKDKHIDAARLLKWNQRIEHFMASEADLGTRYLARFKAGREGIQAPQEIIDPFHRDLWFHLKSRILRLEEFIQEFSDHA